ncbi:MAG TPA: hypothetical protein VFX12_05795 [Vicinamibacterales bacterium]|nr:hypothetical protein [Vicinamibacterales bacterium]
MAHDEAKSPVQGGLSDDEKRNNVIRYAFGGSAERFEAFCRILKEAIPPGTGAVLRGSAITGKRWKDGAPFDAAGPGTSDLDVTLVGGAALQLFKTGGFFIPGLHSRPLSDDDPEIAPALVHLREQLINMMDRPVNIQASGDSVIHFRGDLLGQPYLTLIERPDE